MNTTSLTEGLPKDPLSNGSFSTEKITPQKESSLGIFGNVFTSGLFKMKGSLASVQAKISRITLWESISSKVQEQNFLKTSKMLLNTAANFFNQRLPAFKPIREKFSGVDAKAQSILLNKNKTPTTEELEDLFRDLTQSGGKLERLTHKTALFSPEKQKELKKLKSNLEARLVQTSMKLTELRREKEKLKKEQKNEALIRGNESAAMKLMTILAEKEISKAAPLPAVDSPFDSFDEVYAMEKKALDGRRFQNLNQADNAAVFLALTRNPA